MGRKPCHHSMGAQRQTEPAVAGEMFWRLQCENLALQNPQVSISVGREADAAGVAASPDERGGLEQQKDSG